MVFINRQVLLQSWSPGADHYSVYSQRAIELEIMARKEVFRRNNSSKAVSGPHDRKASGHVEEQLVYLSYIIVIKMV